MSQAPSSGAGNPVRLFRVAAGSSAELLALSPHYGGCFTHWVRPSGGKKGQSKYCRPEGCPPDRHKAERYWKGYAACLLSKPADKLLEPVVLEITEHCELDLRGRWARGQWWRFDHRAEKSNRHEPITATLIGQLELSRVPPAFDFRNVLLHVFHEQQLDLGIANPMPPRVVMAAVPYQQELFRLQSNGEVKKDGAAR